MKSEAQEISEAVASWLHYKSLTGLKGLLKESSMAVPIAEYLSTRHGREVESEKPHPLFNSGGKGRPKQIDFVRVKHGEKSWHAAYETKFQTQSFDLIINDVCRLLCLSQDLNIGNPNRFLIYASQAEKDTPFLDNKFNTGDGRRVSYFEGILPLKAVGEKLNTCAFRIAELHEKQQITFKKFMKEQDVKLPSKISIKIEGFYETGGYLCATWRILAQKGSKLINETEL